MNSWNIILIYKPLHDSVTSENPISHEYTGWIPSYSEENQPNHTSILTKPPSCWIIITRRRHRNGIYKKPWNRISEHPVSILSINLLHTMCKYSNSLLWNSKNRLVRQESTMNLVYNDLFPSYNRPKTLWWQYGPWISETRMTHL